MERKMVEKLLTKLKNGENLKRDELFKLEKEIEIRQNDLEMMKKDVEERKKQLPEERQKVIREKRKKIEKQVERLNEESKMDEHMSVCISVFMSCLAIICIGCGIWHALQMSPMFFSWIFAVCGVGAVAGAVLLGKKYKKESKSEVELAKKLKIEADKLLGEEMNLSKMFENKIDKSTSKKTNARAKKNYEYEEVLSNEDIHTL